MGTTPEIGLENASRRVILMNDVETPSAETGVVPEICEVTEDAAPAVNVTVPPAFTTGVAIERVFTWAFVNFNVQVEDPVASEAEQAPYTFVEPVFVAVNVGVEPETALLFASFRTMVTVELAVPSAMTGPVPEMVEFAATADPAVKVTVPPAFTTGVAMESVFTSALVDFNVQVDVPVASVEEQVP